MKVKVPAVLFLCWTVCAVASANASPEPGADIRDWRVSATVWPADKILFDVGEKPELVLDIRDRDGKPVSEPGAKAVLRWYRTYGSYVSETIALDGTQIRRSMALDKPGAVTCEVTLLVRGDKGDVSPRRAIEIAPRKDEAGYLGADGKHNAVKMRYEGYARVLGCVFGWDKIGPGKPAPADLDRVWNELLEADAKLPIEVKKCELARTTPTGVRVYRVVINSLGDDVHAEMSIPKEADDGKKFPIWCLFQPYGCANMTTWTLEGAITIAPNTHSIENGRESAYYSKLFEKGGPLFNYGFDGKTNAKLETTYFRNILLRDIRSVRYLMTRPEWDRGKITYYGGSQGAYQSAALMGLLPEKADVTLICPWSIDLGGSPAHWRPRWGEGIQYCDPVNLAHRVKGLGRKVNVYFGVVDIACPVDGVFAWINALPRDIELSAKLYQNKGHNVADGEKRYHVEICRKPGEEIRVVPHFDLPRVYPE